MESRMNKERHQTLLKKMKNIAGLLCLLVILTAVGCQPNVPQSPVATKPQTLRDVPSLRLNYRFETDVPAPTINVPLQSEERNAAVQADFDQNRPQEQLDKTLASPDKLRVLAVYHRAGDLPAEFRLDMYSPEGKLIRKISYDGMAVHFAETIVWSPDSSAVAFVAMIRGSQTGAIPSSSPTENQTNSNVATNLNSAANLNTNSANTNADANANVDANANSAPAQTPVTDAPKAVLTFRTEQIYIANREGADVKALTQNEGLIYFYFVWSPDSSALAAMAVTFQEWNYLMYQAELKQELYTPAGRPRLVEKTGRERRLDDNLTNVRPVWSPDSAKVAVAFATQTRIYDAIGDAPTQAAIPLINQLKISSKVFDENLARQEQVAVNTNANTNANTNVNINISVTANQETSVLPDESSLVSFNPIISLEWTEDSLLYLQTGYIKQMKNEADSARSYLRWHRLIFSPQAAVLGN
jgi:hypothetical protein